MFISFLWRHKHLYLTMQEGGTAIYNVPQSKLLSCFLRSLRERLTSDLKPVRRSYPLMYLLLLASLSMMVMTGTQLSLCLRELNAPL